MHESPCTSGAAPSLAPKLFYPGLALCDGSLRLSSLMLLINDLDEDADGDGMNIEIVAVALESVGLQTELSVLKHMMQILVNKGHINMDDEGFITINED